ncbi:4a-hydroxytetrahydrobiopterin dehydratase [Fistulifera solaris]|uniref:4a-hydroxytetrahydrobiopterin dehydratase n=1 Tax=Fistulifera solaris TaxID=1519565 RepID=A0A1Z5JWJ7_FISSO|nr:4a-hydroxytetrahydrobiopterin dehydratase [Fistulifera solaris]|eukprot:GAX18212.1 4a-hydroxytetrahydrobiopterin dehydratase [Fistulifera solaris]
MPVLARLVFARSSVQMQCIRSFATKLSHRERVNALAELHGKWGPDSWELAPGRDAIHKTYVFADFRQAWDFMSRSAELAEEKDHHPEWFNVYNTVEVTWATHDAGGVTEKV